MMVKNFLIEHDTTTSIFKSRPALQDSFFCVIGVNYFRELTLCQLVVYEAYKPVQLTGRLVEQFIFMSEGGVVSNTFWIPLNES